MRVRSLLEAAGVVFAESETRWLLEAAAASKLTAPLVDASEIDEAAEQRALELTQRRAGGEPLQYVTGVAGFRHLELVVGPGAFIPRPETELVAERAMERLPPGGTLVDVGTGSGAIALAVAHERSDTRVLATDTSGTALAWAEKNRDALGLSVELIRCDLLAGLPTELRGEVDVVVSNPPYVPEGDDSLLARDVVHHEPHEALFGGPDGLEIIARVGDQARAWLRRGGWLVLEIGYDQAGAVTKMLQRLDYERMSVTRDLAGRDRIAEGRRG
jgi:release factor glutamine methyltransferase